MIIEKFWKIMNFFNKFLVSVITYYQIFIKFTGLLNYFYAITYLAYAVETLCVWNFVDGKILALDVAGFSATWNPDEKIITWSQITIILNFRFDILGDTPRSFDML